MHENPFLKTKFTSLKVLNLPFRKLNAEWLMEKFLSNEVSKLMNMTGAAAQEA